MDAQVLRVRLAAPRADWALSRPRLVKRRRPRLCRLNAHRIRPAQRIRPSRSEDPSTEDPSDVLGEPSGANRNRGAVALVRPASRPGEMVERGASRTEDVRTSQIA